MCEICTNLLNGLVVAQSQADTKKEDMLVSLIQRHHQEKHQADDLKRVAGSGIIVLHANKKRGACGSPDKET